MKSTVITQAIETHLEQKRARQNRQFTPHNYCYASGYHPCVKHLYHDMKDGDSLPEFTPETLAKFERGNDREDALIHMLQDAGKVSEPPFKIAGTQMPLIIQNESGDKLISGKGDLMIQFEGEKPVPAEIKSWQTFTTDKLNRPVDLLDGVWTRKAAYQLAVYVTVSDAPYGYMILDRPGIPRPIKFDRELCEMLVHEFMDLAIDAQSAFDCGNEPLMTDDLSECPKCKWYGLVCNPDIESKCADILTDPELLEMIEARHDLTDQYKLYSAIDKKVKAKLRGIETGIAGNFLIQGKWGKSTRYEIPDEIKAEYKVEDEKGRFTLKITPVD